MCQNAHMTKGFLWKNVFYELTKNITKLNEGDLGSNKTERLGLFFLHKSQTGEQVELSGL